MWQHVVERHVRCVQCSINIFCTHQQIVHLLVSELCTHGTVTAYRNITYRTVRTFRHQNKKTSENFALIRQYMGSKFWCSNRWRPVIHQTGIKTNAFTLLCSSQDNLRRRFWSWRHCCHMTTVFLLLLVERWRNENFALIASGYSFHFQKIPRKPPPPPPPPPPSVSFVLHLSSY